MLFLKRAKPSHHNTKAWHTYILPWHDLPLMLSENLFLGFTLYYMALKNKDKIELAKLLFFQNMSQIEIAAKIGISKVSINKWVKKYLWEDQRTSFTVTRESILRQLYQQIAAVNNVIADRTPPTSTSSESDTIIKIANAIDKLERESSLADIISVSQKFLNWIRKLDLEKAKEMSGLFDAFIKDNLK